MEFGGKSDGYLSGVWQALAHTFTATSSFLSPLPVLLAFAIAVPFVARHLREQGQNASLLAIVRELVPLRMWRHRSTLHDLVIILFNEGLLFAVPAVIVSAVFLSRDVIATWLGMSATGPAGEPSSGFAIVAFAIYMMLLWDFAATYAHYLKHRVPILWEFHKIHHCAEVLTPLTAMRRHPVEMIVSRFITAGIIAIGLLAWLAIFQSPGTAIEIGGLALGVWLWRLLGYNLRHMHIWISYGPVWNRLLMSPAHHQIHHSRDAEHYDTNFGHIFPLWDWLLGTLYDPERAVPISFGIPESENAELRSLKGMLFVPFRRALSLLRQPDRAGA